MSRVPRSSRVFRHLHPQALPPTGFGEGSMRMSRCCRVCLDPGSRSRLVGGPPAPSALREPQHQETGAEVSGPWGSSDFYGRDSVSEGSTGWGGAGGRVGGLPVSPSMAQATPAPSAGRSELAEMQFQEPTGFLQLRSQVGVGVRLADVSAAALSPREQRRACRLMCTDTLVCELQRPMAERGPWLCILIPEPTARML